MRRQTSRRDFMKNVTVASVGAYVGHGLAFPKQVRSANEEINVASIGVGGKGGGDSQHASQFGNVVAICDVDRNTLESKGKSKGFENAEQFTDYRELLAKHGKKIDIATISTPDHMHAPATLEAMRDRKSVV